MFFEREISSSFVVGVVILLLLLSCVGGYLLTTVVEIYRERLSSSSLTHTDTDGARYYLVAGSW